MLCVSFVFLVRLGKVSEEALDLDVLGPTVARVR